MTDAENIDLRLVRGRDTGDRWKCPVCNKTFILIHVEYDPPCKRCKQHDFEEVIQ